MTVRFDGVSFTYPGSAVPALRDLSLTLAAGEVTWLFGKLGAGSSTALLVAGGFAPILTGGERRGSVRVGGLDPGDPATRAALAGRIAYVSAQPHLQLSGLAETVFEEVAFAPANLGWSQARIREAVPQALARIGAGHLAERVPTELSGGELQRVVIAAMLVLAPEVWLLDEPASALDPGARAAAYGLFREEARRGAAVILATEDADGALEAADRIVVLEHGAVAQDGDPAAVLASDACWLLGAGSTTIGELWRAAMDRTPAMARGSVPLTLGAAVQRVTGR
ncbi:MAG TPA: ABC transporter ATP-binding protein [Gemmatimonadales bacterium]|nr:ABC transporter ATP-binding protein [Gemmatimonadales bacterium]